MSFHEKDPVRIHFEEVGSGPLLLIAGGGLDSTIARFLLAPLFDDLVGPLVIGAAEQGIDLVAELYGVLGS